MQQGVTGPQSPTTGAKATGHLVESAARIEELSFGPMKIEDGQNDDGSQDEQTEPPLSTRLAPGRLRRGRRGLHGTSGMVRRRIGRPTYWNAAFTSGLKSTTNTQMPTGIPMQQQGEMQGMMARMAPVTANV